MANGYGLMNVCWSTLALFRDTFFIQVRGMLHAGSAAATHAHATQQQLLMMMRMPGS
jgi:hypothetical protein